MAPRATMLYAYEDVMFMVLVWSWLFGFHCACFKWSFRGLGLSNLNDVFFESLGTIMNWNFVLPVYKGPDLRDAIEDPSIAYIVGFPNDLVVQHILSRVLDGCNPLVSRMSYDVTLLCNLLSINHAWRWLLSIILSFVAFHPPKHWLRCQ